METVAGILVIVFLLWVMARNQRYSARKLGEAKKAYEDSLNRLKQTPADADLKQRTLGLGRAYSNLTRNRKGATLYDEVALSNDISAACAGASALPGRPPMAASAEERLGKLSDLKGKGLISEEEYQARRHEILRDV